MVDDTPMTEVPKAELEELRKRAAECDDMQRRAEAAEALLARETTLRENILWNLPLYFVTMSCTGEIVSMNNLALQRLELGMKAIEGESFVRSLVPEDWQTTAERYLEAALTADRPVVYSCPVQHGGGDPIPIEWHVLPLRDADGEPALLCQAGIETEHERSRSTMHVRQSDRLSALGQLTAGIAHDFNNLLQAIQGNVSLMLLDLDELLDRQVQSGAAMTRRLLAFTETGRPKATRLDLNHQVREVAEFFSRARRDLSVKLDLVPEPAMVEVDPHLLDQLILDLLTGAAANLPQGGRIGVSTSRESQARGAAGGPQLVITVHDAGRPAGTADATRRTGLAQLVELLGGTLEYSAATAGGNTIAVRLTDQSGPAARETGPAQLPARAEKGRVLLVDDDQVVLDVGARLLRKLGFAVTTAVGGREAIEVFARQHDFDVVILDLIMPDMSGREVFDRMISAHPDTVILVASGYNLRAEAANLLARGAAGFLQKPFRLRELEERVNALLPR